MDISQPAIEVTLGGKLYLAAPLTDRQITELDTWVRGEYIRNARESLDDSMTESQRDKEMEKVRATAAGLSAFGSVGVAMFGTVEGISRLAWQSLRKNHPDMTFEKFRHELFDISNPDAAANILQFNQTFRQVNKTPNVPIRQSEKKVPRKVMRHV